MLVRMALWYTARVNRTWRKVIELVAITLVSYFYVFTSCYLSNNPVPSPGAIMAFFFFVCVNKKCILWGYLGFTGVM